MAENDIVIKVSADTKDFNKKISEAEKNAAKAAKEMEKAAKEAEKAYEKAAKAMDDAFVSPGKMFASGLKVVTKPFENFANSIEAATAKWNKLLSSIGRIALYRAIRKVIKDITQGVQEGVENLYQYSTFFGTQFSKSLDQAASSALFIKNSFAAMVAPIVNVITPAVEALARTIGNAANEMAEFFAIVTKGVGAQYSKAIWYTKKYKEAAKSAKESLTLLGFDEINRLNGDNGSGTDSDPTKMFEEAFAGEGDSLASQLAQSIKNDDWDSVGRALAEMLGKALDYIKSSDIATKIAEKVNNAIKGINGFLSEANFGEIALTITDFFKKLTIDWEGVGQAWMGWKTKIFDFIFALVSDTEFWRKVGEDIGNFFKGALNNLTTWINKVDWEKLGADVFNGFVELIRGIDIKTVADKLGALLWGALQAVGEFFVGLAKKAWEWIVGAFTGKNTQSPFNSYNGVGMLGNGVFKGDTSSVYAKTNSSDLLEKLAMLDNYASGGYVPRGDLFIANEAGPELVGTMNGRTYVGSNQDINAVGNGIENAVYAGVNLIVNAIQNKDMSVNLDGNKLTKSVTTIQNRNALARG